LAQPLKRLPPEKLDAIRAMLDEDVRPTEIARRLGLGWRQFKGLKKTDDALAELIELALAREEEDLLATIRGSKAGVPITGAIFLLKARFGYRDSTPEPRNAQAPVQVAVITLPAPAASAEAYLTHIRAAGLLPPYQPTAEDLALI
jgi:hypothetical protein